MKKLPGNEMVLIIAAALLLISIILMFTVLPGVYINTLPNEYNTGAFIGILFALIIRLLIFFWYISTIKGMRQGRGKSQLSYIVTGVLLIIFGLIYLYGAFAFLDKKNMLCISYLMFASVFIDVMASIVTFAAAYLNSNARGQIR